MNQWWSVGLTAGALVSAWLIGSKVRVAFLLAAALQLAWAAYAVATAQLAFLASAALFTVVNVRNYRRWGRDDQQGARPADYPGSVTGEVERYATSYEAYYHLIALETPQLVLPSETYYVRVHCLDEACERDDGSNWMAEQPSLLDARESGLEHCRDVHTFEGAT